MDSRAIPKLELSFGTLFDARNSAMVALLCLLISIIYPSQCSGQILQDVSSQVSVKKSGLVYNRITKTFNALVSVTNSSTATLNSLVLLVSNISPTSVTLANASSQDSSGNRYINLVTPAAGLGPGQTISNALLEFNNPSGVAFTFSPTVETNTAIVATLDGDNVVFKTPGDMVVLTIALINQETTSGTITSVTHERAIISDDGSHAGIFTYSSSLDSANPDYEPLVNVGFRYFDSSGLKWQSQAPLGTGYFFPVQRHQKLLASDGTRVLLVSTGSGNSDPHMNVTDEAGNSLYMSTDSPVAVSDARLSPSGRYLLSITVVKNLTTYNDLITIVNLDSGRSMENTFDRIADGLPTITTTSTGDFMVSLKGKQVPLP
jgi:hypothetical protein